MKLKLLILLLVIHTSNTFAQHEFITTWKTDNSGTSTNTEITIPTFAGETYNYDIDWDNDGTFDQFGITGNVTYDFGTVGTYTIRIQGVFPRIYFNDTGDKNKIIAIEQWGTNTWTSMASAFSGASNVVGNATDTPDLSVVTDMSYMFYKTSEFDTDISSWNTSNVTNMSSMFERANYNQPLNNWNTSNVTNMSSMFKEAIYFDQPLDNWDTSRVTNMSSMFQSALNFDNNISTWNTSNVTTMKLMFNDAADFSSNINSWDTSSVTNMSSMFAYTTNISNLGSWNTSSVTNMSYMFYESTYPHPSISGWDTSAVTNMNSMFYNNNFDADLSSWNVESVTNFGNFLRGTTMHRDDYDALLIAWSAQNLKPNLIFDAGHAQYCSTDAQIARANIIASHNWTIYDNGLHDSCTSLSTNDYVLDLSISAYPNPVRDNLSIKCETILQQVSVFDINGRKLLEFNLHNSTTETTLTLNTLNNGLYFVTITSDKGQRTIKVIKD